MQASFVLRAFVFLLGFASLDSARLRGNGSTTVLQQRGNRSTGTTDGTLETVRKHLAEDWSNVLKNEDGRVGKASFVEFFKTKYDMQTADFEQFLDAAFDAGTAMMLPNKKTDLGQHCFSYAGLMAGEYYFTDGPRNALGSELVTTDWNLVDKIAGRVDKTAFLQFFKKKYATQTADFGQFLDAAFDAGTAMMLPDKKTDLGKHCFSYAGLLAGEYYFPGGPADALRLA